MFGDEGVSKRQKSLVYRDTGSRWCNRQLRKQNPCKDNDHSISKLRTSLQRTPHCPIPQKSVYKLCPGTLGSSAPTNRPIQPSSSTHPPRSIGSSARAGNSFAWSTKNALPIPLIFHKRIPKIKQTFELNKRLINI